MLEVMVQHSQNLGIDFSIFNPDNLSSDLMKLAVTPFLRTLITKHRPHVIQFRNRVEIIEPVLNERTHHRDRPFRAQGDGMITLIVKCVHLFFNNICRFPDRATEKLCFFRNRCADFSKSVSPENFAYRLLQKLPGFDFTRQDIIHPFYCSDIQNTILF